MQNKVSTRRLLFFSLQELDVKQNIERVSKTRDDNRGIRTIASDVWTGVKTVVSDVRTGVKKDYSIRRVDRSRAGAGDERVALKGQAMLRVN